MTSQSQVPRVAGLFAAPLAGNLILDVPYQERKWEGNTGRREGQRCGKERKVGATGCKSSQRWPCSALVLSAVCFYKRRNNLSIKVREESFKVQEARGCRCPRC